MTCALGKCTACFACFLNKGDFVKNVVRICAAVAVSLMALPAAAGTLQMTFEASYSISVGPTASNSTNPNKLSPILTLGFANSTDYAALSNPASGPKFGVADLVSVEWDRLESMHFTGSASDPDNPPLTQALFDSLTFTFGSTPGIFAPVTGAMTNNSLIYFADSSSTTFTNGPMLLLRISGTEIKVTGNWDDDVFDDSSKWRLGQTSVDWNPSATSFVTGPTDPVTTVPLPAGLPLLLAGLGALGIARRRR